MSAVPKRSPTLPDSDIELRLLLEATYLKYSYDFRQYSAASMKRRVLQFVHELGMPSISALQDKVIHDPQVFLDLLQRLTVPVSEMFRDPSYFLAIREKVVPLLRTYPSLKVWVAGCSTGEEVFSLAILLQEEELLDRTIIYATDINPRSLERAERGVYSVSEIRKFTGNYQKAGGTSALSDYYTAAPDSVIFSKALKRHVTFADHSLATDSVFSETHLISCRNVLIYFERALQDRAIGLFRESLSRKCFLGLGSKETVEFSAHARHFKAISPQERIYQRMS